MTATTDRRFNVEFLSGLLIGLLLGVFAASLLAYMLWQFSAPVNKWPAPGVGHGAVQMEEGRVSYEFLGVTGSEE